MKSIALFAAATAMFLPEVDSSFLRNYFPRGDYVAAELWVSPEGRVLECKLVEPKVTEAVTARACTRMIGRRAVAKPPTGPDGAASHGLLTGAILSSRQPGGLPVQPPPANHAVEITVDSLPKNVGAVTHHVTGYIDSTGKLTHCQRQLPSESNEQGVACRLVIGKRLGQRNGADGTPVPYVVNFSVIFVAKSAQP